MGREGDISLILNTPPSRRPPPPPHTLLPHPPASHLSPSSRSSLYGGGLESGIGNADESRRDVDDSGVCVCVCVCVPMNLTTRPLIQACDSGTGAEEREQMRVVPCDRAVAWIHLTREASTGRAARAATPHPLANARISHDDQPKSGGLTHYWFTSTSILKC
jgi:hypothetical protein